MNAPPTKKVGIIGVPMDLGAGRRGVDMGPSALRLAGLVEELAGLGYEVLDRGNLCAVERAGIVEGDPRLRYLDAIAEMARDVHREVVSVLEERCTPLVVGGDHAISIGSVAAVLDVAQRRGENVGVVWLDAHADMNTHETTPSGNIHGMALASLLGEGVDALTQIGQARISDPSNVVLFGTRDIDVGEVPLIMDAGIRACTMREIDRRGGILAAMEHVLQECLSDCDKIHVSLDMDFVDPRHAPGVGTPVRGGPSYREAHLVMELLCATRKVCSMDIVEVNPVLDEKNITAELAVGLAATLFGHNIIQTGRYDAAMGYLMGGRASH